MKGTATTLERRRSAEPAAQPRRPVAVFLSRFPVITETFILREVLVLEEMGRTVELVPLIREDPEVVHREAEPWMERALFTPAISAEIVRANLRALLRQPLRYLKLLSWVLGSSLRKPRLLLGSLNAFPKSVRLAEILADRGVGHLHAHFATHATTAAMIVSELTGIPFSFTAHAHDIFVPWRRAMLERKLRRAAFVRVISEFNARYLQERYGEDLAPKMRVIHVGVRPEDYEAPPEEGDLRDDPCDHSHPQGIRFLCVASFQEYKGLPFLVEACRILRDGGVAFHLDIVGRGPMKEQIHGALRRLDLDDRVHLLGPRPQHEVTRLMRHADAFVLPSIIDSQGQMEGIPVALMEALASRRPVVATAISGIPELVRDGETGLLVPPGEPEPLAEAMGALAEDPARRRTLGEAGREHVRREFSLTPCTRELLREIEAHAEPLPADLAEALGKLLRPQDGSVAVRRLREGRDSRVAELEVRGESAIPEERICKVHRDRPGQSRPPRQRARREEELLRTLGPALVEASAGTPIRLGVPRPIRTEPGSAALLLERCAGRPVDGWIRAERLRPGGERLRRVMEASGTWLGAFQEILVERPEDPEERLELLTRRAYANLEACVGLPDGLRVELRERIPRLREWLHDGSLCLGRRHGDYWPGNVWVALDDDGRHAESVQAIDFEGHGVGFPWEDAGYWLVHTQVYFAYPLLRWRYRALSTAFLSGWRRGGDLDPAAVGLGRILAALEKLTSRPGHSASFRERRLRRTLLRVLRQG